MSVASRSSHAQTLQSASAFFRYTCNHTDIFTKHLILHAYRSTVEEIRGQYSSIWHKIVTLHYLDGTTKFMPTPPLANNNT